MDSSKAEQNTELIHMKTYIYNPESGAPVKNWFDGHSYWSLEVGEVAAFPERSAEMLKDTYGFLQVISLEEFEARLAKLDKEEVSTVRPNADGQIVPKSEAELEADKKALEAKKKEAKALKSKVEKAKDAEPAQPAYWEMPRGALIAEVAKREIDVKGLGKKGSYISKEQLINYLESDDASK